MADKTTYTGKINNAGAQKVDAPVKAHAKTTNKVITGKNDLRSSKK